MFAVIRRYNINPGTADRITQRVNESFLPQMRSVRGFVGYWLVKADESSIVSVSIFEERDGAEESNRLASTWVRENIQHMIKTAPVILTGEILAHDIAAVTS